MSEEGSPAAGAATDSLGRAVLDPTKNVLDLVEAAVTRLNDLRNQESEHRNQLDGLRDRYQRELRVSEAARLDAIRLVDVQAVQQGRIEAEQRATTLANQVINTATAFDAKLTLALDPIQKRLDDLTRAQYEAVGQKTQVVETQARGGSIATWIAVAFAVVVFIFSTAISLVGIYLATRGK